MSAEKFMYQFVRALRFRTTMDFKEQFRSVDVLMIDDIQFICGKDSTQEEFFHTFNALVDQNRQIVVSADKSPSDLEGMEERLRSRLGCGLVADIHPTDYELRLGILKDKAERLGAKLPDKVIEFLAHKINSNVRELEGALNRVIAYSQLIGDPITIQLASQALKSLLAETPADVISIDQVLSAVSEHTGVSVDRIIGKRRDKATAEARRIAMYMLREDAHLTSTRIGQVIGGKDHSTVLYAQKRFEQLMETDNSKRHHLAAIRNILTRSPQVSA
jgi:chromosomal replication initiator protein